MSLRRTLAVVLRYLYLLRGSPARFLPLFAWVAVDILLWGFITRYLNTVATPGANFVPALLGAVLLWDFFTRVMQGVTTAFFEDVWSRNFLNVFASPITIPEYLSGLVATGVTTSLVGLLVMLVLAWAAFGLSFLAYGVAVVPFLLVLFLFGCAIVLRLGPASEWFVWPIPAVISPFVGVFYPIATLPEWMRWVAHLLPPTHVFEGLRSIVAGRGVAMPTLWMGIALAGIYVGLAYWCFARVFRRAVRTGLIARYSAESVS
jgi:ABC-2 type transport system permease protein